MKQTRKILAMLLCIAMVLGMAITASAYSIEIGAGDKAPVKGHTYSVYQIYTGDLYNGILSNIKYGSSYTGKDGAVPQTELDNLTDEAAAAAFAKQLVQENKLGDPVATLEAPYFKADKLDAGYYLIVDNGGAAGAENDAMSAYIVKIVGDINITPKSEVPTLDKIISDDNNQIEEDGVDIDIDENGKHNNVSIGSLVQYTLTAKIPSNANKYDYFYFIINDTLSDGLTLINSEEYPVVVKAGETVLSSEGENPDYALYTGDAADGEYDLQVALLDAKSHPGETITVTYWAMLNENAVIGEKDGNPNTADLDYSNDPNFNYEGTQKPDEPGKPQPGQPDDEVRIPIGDTPDAVTRTYTTGLKLIKIDENGSILTGAEFKIEGDNLVEILTVETVAYKADENGTYYKLTDGTYTTDAPHGDYYEKKTDNRDGGYVKVGENEYREATAEELADENVELYTKVLSNESYYETPVVKYSIDYVTYTNKTEVANQTYTATVNNKGELILTGLGEGTYTITETKAPDGYNLLTGSIEVKIEWEEPSEGNNCNWTATAKYQDKQDKETELNMTEGGIFELEIENKSGSTLPETGGIGTTLFYVFGGIMVLGAAVLLVTKKRMTA